ncbi:MAG TPA: flavin reductase family protein [Rugosimonospora sp.]|nr:flavin reductase family protein [Rugosimonospora sp.]
MLADVEEFTRTMACVPAPVTVLTMVDSQGLRWGLTASSFISLSLRPALVLICLDRNASTHDAFSRTSHFMVNVLAQEHADIARRFARRGVDRFAAGDTVPCELNLPGIPSASARIACSTYQILDGGDHSILIGRVEAVHAGDTAALAYCDRSFGRVVRADAVESTRMGAVPAGAVAAGR